MGFGSKGTRIFDEMTEKIITNTSLDDRAKKDLIQDLADVLHDEDWDQEGETKFYDDPMVRDVLGFHDE